MCKKNIFYFIIFMRKVKINYIIKFLYYKIIIYWYKIIKIINDVLVFYSYFRIIIMRVDFIIDNNVVI